MKKLILLVCALLILAQGQAAAQETEPLAMRIMLEWTVAGSMLGAAVGAMLWLTDPGNPNNRFNRQAIEGSALGAVAGAGFGIYVMRRAVIYPVNFAQAEDPLDPANRLTADPVAAKLDSERPLVFGGGSGGFQAGSAQAAGGDGNDWGFSLPVLNLRF